ncbi:MAG: tyrosine-type recombinase/integrase, partial [Oscillospiraceae bacterium]|nr:tyrosine-type recombinase/integrase [Oscillospiraceae bacterium]
NKRIDKRRVQQIVEENLTKAGLGNLGVSTHKLRHTAATLMYQHGNVDTLVLKNILGHKSIATTEIYTHLSDESMKKAADSSPLSNVKNTNKPKEVKSFKKDEE